ncbi:MAG: DUF1501 domain-containing protein [Myxococcota bacterium]
MLSRRGLLRSGAAAGLLGRVELARAASSSPPEFLVVVFANGGWDVTFAMDPKPADDRVDGPWVDATQNPDDVEELRVINGIPVQCNDLKRKSVTSFFETWGDQTAVINGIWTGSIVHQPSRIRMLTGTASAEEPDFASITGASKGVSVDLPLGTIDFSGLGYAGQFAAKTGRIGYSSQFKSLLDPTAAFGAPPDADYSLPVWLPDVSQEAAVHQHLLARVAKLRKVYGDGGHNDQLLDDMIESYARRERLLENAELIAGRLPIGVAPSLDLQADVAVDLLAGGVCHTITLADMQESWDTHDSNTLQHDNYQALFTSVNRLLDALRTRGILERTLVVVMSEMTRTPKRNWKGGKDHWAHTSQLWIGSGVKGGTVVGGTDEYVESLPVDLATGEVRPDGQLNKYDNLVAGLVAHLGVDPEPYFPGVVPFRGASV